MNKLGFEILIFEAGGRAAKRQKPTVMNLLSGPRVEKSNSEARGHNSYSRSAELIFQTKTVTDDVDVETDIDADTDVGSRPSS